MLKTFLLIGASVTALAAGSAQALTTYNYTGGSQTFTAGLAGSYTIDAYGAQGGSSTFQEIFALGGSGAGVGGTFALTAGEVLDIAVGGAGQNHVGTGYGGGGGGSFVTHAGADLLVAGGGGGAYFLTAGDDGLQGASGYAPHFGDGVAGGFGTGRGGGSFFGGTGGQVDLGLHSGDGLVTIDLQAPVGGVPEPSSWAMLMLGFAATGAAMRRRLLRLA